MKWYNNYSRDAGKPIIEKRTHKSLHRGRQNQNASQIPLQHQNTQLLVVPQKNHKNVTYLSHLFVRKIKKKNHEPRKNSCWLRSRCLLRAVTERQSQQVKNIEHRCQKNWRFLTAIWLAHLHYHNYLYLAPIFKYKQSTAENQLFQRHSRRLLH